MSNFLFKILLNGRSSAVPTMCFLRSFSLEYGSLNSNSNSNPNSFTVSYLVKSCGFSLESAESASKRVHFKTPAKPDSVLEFFKNNGFSDSQILLIIRSIPNLLSSSPLKSFSPKLEYLLSKGFSTSEIAKIVSTNPLILKRSLEKCIIPGYTYLKNFLQSDEKTIACVRSYSYFLSDHLENYVEFTANELRKVGVPELNIVYYLHYQPRLFRHSARTKESVEAIKNMGFNPMRIKFMEALHAVLAMSKSTWARKVNAYKKWGWSEEDVLSAFRIRPRCMAMSEDKITASMDYFVNKMGWNSTDLAKSPVLLLFRLDTRIKPRASVLQFLSERGLFFNNSRSYSPYNCSDQVFLQKFVHPHLKQAPQILKIYEQCRSEPAPDIMVSQIHGSCS